MKMLIFNGFLLFLGWYLFL